MKTNNPLEIQYNLSVNLFKHDHIKSLSPGQLEREINAFEGLQAFYEANNIKSHEIIQLITEDNELIFKRRMKPLIQNIQYNLFREGTYFNKLTKAYKILHLSIELFTTLVHIHSEFREFTYQLGITNFKSFRELLAEYPEKQKIFYEKFYPVSLPNGQFLSELTYKLNNKRPKTNRLQTAININAQKVDILKKVKGFKDSPSASYAPIIYLFSLEPDVFKSLLYKQSEKHSQKSFLAQFKITFEHLENLFSTIPNSGFDIREYIAVFEIPKEFEVYFIVKNFLLNRVTFKSLTPSPKPQHLAYQKQWAPPATAPFSLLDLQLHEVPILDFSTQYYRFNASIPLSQIYSLNKQSYDALDFFPEHQSFFTFTSLVENLSEEQAHDIKELFYCLLLEHLGDYINQIHLRFNCIPEKLIIENNDIIFKVVEYFRDFLGVLLEKKREERFSKIDFSSIEGGNLNYIQSDFDNTSISGEESSFIEELPQQVEDWEIPLVFDEVNPMEPLHLLLILSDKSTSNFIRLLREYYDVLLIVYRNNKIEFESILSYHSEYEAIFLDSIIELFEKEFDQEITFKINSCHLTPTDENDIWIKQKNIFSGLSPKTFERLLSRYTVVGFLTRFQINTAIFGEDLNKTNVFVKKILEEIHNPYFDLYCLEAKKILLINIPDNELKRFISNETASYIMKKLQINSDIMQKIFSPNIYQFFMEAIILEFSVICSFISENEVTDTDLKANISNHIKVLQQEVKPLGDLFKHLPLIYLLNLNSYIFNHLISINNHSITTLLESLGLDDNLEHPFLKNKMFENKNLFPNFTGNFDLSRELKPTRPPLSFQINFNNKGLSIFNAPPQHKNEVLTKNTFQNGIWK